MNKQPDTQTKRERLTKLFDFLKAYTDRCWRKSDLSEPYPKGVCGFETVWHVDGHYFSLLGLADYRFGFQVLLQPEDPAFPTDPRLFEPTEGSKRIVTYCVDQDAAGGEFSRHTIGPFRIR